MWPHRLAVVRACGRRAKGASYLTLFTSPMRTSFTSSALALALGAAVLCTEQVFADVYMHNPRGSNDRNCERNVNRNNGNRLFDSQNNAKGGYACPRAVGDSTTQDEAGVATFSTFPSLCEIDALSKAQGALTLTASLRTVRAPCSPCCRLDHHPEHEDVLLRRIHPAH